MRFSDWIKNKVRIHAPKFGYRITNNLLREWYKSCQGQRIYPYLYVFDYDNNPKYNDPDEKWRQGEVCWDGKDGVILLWIPSTKIAPHGYLLYLGLHEMRHCYQSKYGTINDEDRDNLIKRLTDGRDTLTDAEREEFHGLLPEEVDADGYAIHKAKFDGLRFDKEVINGGKKRFRLKDYKLY